MLFLTFFEGVDLRLTCKNLAYFRKLPDMCVKFFDDEIEVFAEDWNDLAQIISRVGVNHEKIKTLLKMFWNCIHLNKIHCRSIVALLEISVKGQCERVTNN